jgi:hypothetical protein
VLLEVRRSSVDSGRCESLGWVLHGVRVVGMRMAWFYKNQDEMDVLSNGIGKWELLLPS